MSDVDNQPLLQVDNLVKHFSITKGILFSRQIGAVKAVDDVSFTISPGETLGLVGESGCGKSTVGRVILGLTKATSGSVFFEGKDIYALSKRELRELRKDMQIIFQDPYASLNPRIPIREIIAEPLQIHKIVESKELDQRIDHLLEVVGLDSSFKRRFPHEFSGGQRQRIGIARALAVDPKFIVCDEPVSALDVSIQAQVVNLLQDLQEEFGLTYLFIAHDLSVIKHISNRVAVMYLGKIVEMADKDRLYNNPRHPYTQALLSAIPVPNPEVRPNRIILHGDVPSPINPPSGCRFHTRCPHVMQICKELEPEMEDKGNRHYAACHLK